MNPLALRATNYRQFETLDLELPPGCLAIVGENGAGKSSVLDAIELALFAGRGELSQWLTTGDATELMLELTFSHGAETYRARRGYSARGAGKTSVDLERADGDRWEALTLGSAKDTQGRLEEILGFTRRTFRASSFLKQSDGAAFSEADPRDRKRILADTLGLDRFDALLQAVRRDRRHAEQQLQQIDGRLQGVTREQLDEQHAQLTAAIDAADENERVAAAAIAAAETELEQAAAAVVAARSAVLERATAVANRDAAAAALAAKVKVREDAAEAAKQAGIVRDEIATLPTPEQAARLAQRELELVAVLEAFAAATRAHEETRTLHETRSREKARLEQQATEAHDRMRALDAQIAHLELGQLDSCPTCKQQLGVEARAATVGSLRAQAQTLADEAEALFERAGAIELPVIPDPPPPVASEVQELDDVRASARAVREAELQRSRLEERLAGYQRQIAAAASPEYARELADVTAALEAADSIVAALPAPVDIGALEAAAVTARGKVELERGRQQTAAQEKAVAQARLDQLTDTIARHERDLLARTDYQAELDLLAILDRAYGPDGIPALIVENAAIPAIEVEANRILVALAGATASCRVELRTDREKKDGGIRDDVLDVVVVTDAGERAYETFSGGERTRLNLALRIALARLLATRRGAESRVLAIDEPEFLDEDGTAALVDVLRELEQTGVFDRVYLVSHVPALRDSFDTVLQVVTDETGRSFVDGARQVERAEGRVVA